jgi:hypothetical protein
MLGARRNAERARGVLHDFYERSHSLPFATFIRWFSRLGPADRTGAALINTAALINNTDPQTVLDDDQQF